jgi:hypothetical protein
MKITKPSRRLSLLLFLPIAACSTLVGADFDDLGPNGGSGGNGGVQSGGNAGTASGGTANNAGVSDNSAGNGGVSGTVGEGGGSSQAGNANAGTTTGGTSSGGTSVQGGGGQGGEAGGGGAGNAGESAAGAGGAETVVPPTEVVLNELKGQGAGADYVELFNTGTETADISGCYVADDSNNRVTFPAGATIAGKGYVVVRLQQTTSTGMVTTCFGFKPCYDGIKWGISASGEKIFLRDSTGALLDQLDYPDEAGPNGVGDTHAFGRVPDGAGTTGAIFTSPGAPNNAVL